MTYGIFSYTGKIVNIVDGDTFDILFDLGFNVSLKHRCRLAGIDTPEVRGPEKAIGKEVSNYVSSLILGKTLQIDVEKRKGKYGRYIVDIHLDNINTTLTEKLISEQKGRRVEY